MLIEQCAPTSVFKFLKFHFKVPSTCIDSLLKTCCSHNFQENQRQADYNRQNLSKDLKYIKALLITDNYSNFEEKTCMCPHACIRDSHIKWSCDNEEITVACHPSLHNRSILNKSVLLLKTMIGNPQVNSSRHIMQIQTNENCNNYCRDGYVGHLCYWICSLWFD